MVLYWPEEETNQSVRKTPHKHSMQELGLQSVQKVQVLHDKLVVYGNLTEASSLVFCTEYIKMIFGQHENWMNYETVDIKENDPSKALPVVLQLEGEHEQVLAYANHILMNVHHDNFQLSILTTDKRTTSIRVSDIRVDWERFSSI